MPHVFAPLGKPIFVSPPLTVPLAFCKNHKLRIAPEVCQAPWPVEQTGKQQAQGRSEHANWRFAGWIYLLSGRL